MKHKKVVFLAAGLGSRIATRESNPKPILSLLGTPLIQRSIESAKNYGLTEFVIVVGYRNEEIKKELGDGSQWGVNIEYVMNKDWTLANGVSLLQAKMCIQDDFLLLMSDHVFEPSCFELFANTVLEKEKKLILFTDHKIDSIFDMDDATKVLEKDNQILSIGKEIQDFNSIDVGSFVLSPDVFAILENEYAQKNDVSISQMVQALIKGQQAITCSIGNAWWQDVDTPGAYTHAEKLLQTFA